MNKNGTRHSAKITNKSAILSIVFDLTGKMMPKFPLFRIGTTIDKSLSTNQLTNSRTRAQAPKP